MSDTGRKRVVVLYKDLAHYRVPFFEALRARLGTRGVDLDLIYGQPAGESAAKADTRELPWATFVRNKTFTLGRTTFYWQPVLRRLRGSDLVIVEQANRLLLNHVLLALDALGVVRLALWGHGRNFQSERPSGVRERFKKWYSRHAHWWFAYNETTAAVVRDTGFPGERITVVQNAIDTKDLQESIARVRPEEIEALKRRLGVTGRNVCLFVGGMYAERRLEFLLEAARRVRARVPDCELVMIGSGPDREIAERAARETSWMHYVGPAFGEELAVYLATGRLLLMPGAVGLGVLDGFAAGVPMVATRVPNNGPEIEYLEDGVNGVVVANYQSEEAFAEAVAALLGDQERYDRLVQGCHASAARYSIEEMADRFAEGVMSALGES